tara:strand:- start:110 stop:313 length:204 start_codon:yes stop_codon:yes gene_type:complete
MERFLKEEYDSYSLVREKRKLDDEAQQVIATLHAKYYKHSFYKPCSCSGKTWQQWVSQLNDIYERGY